jgi:hypothetical protein
LVIFQHAAHVFEIAVVQNANAVAVAFTEGTNGKGCGVVLYKIGADGALDGKWGGYGSTDVGTETAKKK